MPHGCLHPLLSRPAPAPPPPQTEEELAAAYARRKPVLVAEPALCLELPEELQQQPPRLDMCSACAWLLQEVRVRHGCGEVVSWKLVVAAC